jgi:fucose permease
MVEVEEAPARIAFERNAVTWFAYALIAYYSYLLNGLGPITPFIRDELELTYTVSSFHFSAFAMGILLAGLGSDALIGRLGRRTTLTAGIVGMVAGTLLLMSGRSPILTIGGSLLMGSIGSCILVMVPAVLTDEHVPNHAIAITEANVIASVCGGSAPVAVSAFASSTIGWRGALMVAALAGSLAAILGRRLAIPESWGQHGEAGRQQAGLPGQFWFYWGLLVVAVAIEFCFVFWSTVFVEATYNVARASAALTTGAFLGAMVVGRLLASRLVRSLGSGPLIAGAIVVAGVGFAAHWWSPWLWASIGGLALAGVGVANLYPLLLAQAIGTAPGRTDLASARASLASGIAILLLPLLLGNLADRLGIGQAYGLIGVLIIALAVMYGVVRGFHPSSAGRQFR